MDIQIELKKAKMFRGHEGYGLNAEIWVDGVKTAYVIDDASGSICYDFTVYNKEKWKKLEEYVESLPAKPMEIDGEPFMRDGKQVMYEPRMEDVVDEIHEAQEKKKHIKKTAAKLVKECEKGLVFTDVPEDQPVDRWWGPIHWGSKFTFAQVLSSPKGREAIQKVISDQKAKGRRLLNKNVPEEILKLIQ